MVVDDEPGVRDLLCDALHIAGYETISAQDGMAALTLLRKEKPVLAIIDINMPLMDGFDLVERMRSEKDMTPVLMLSAKLPLIKGVNPYMKTCFLYIHSLCNSPEISYT